MDRKSFLKSVGAASTIPIGSAFAKSNDVTVHFLKAKHVYSSYDHSPISSRHYTFDVCDGMHSLNKLEDSDTLVADPCGKRMSNLKRTMKKIQGEFQQGFPCVDSESHKIVANPGRIMTDEEFIKVFYPKCTPYSLHQEERLYRKNFEEEDLKSVKECVSSEIRKKIQTLIDAGCKTVYIETKSTEKPFQKIDNCEVNLYHTDPTMWNKLFVGCKTNTNYGFIGYTEQHVNPFLNTYKYDAYGKAVRKKVTKNEIEKTIYNYSQEKDYDILV